MSLLDELEGIEPRQKDAYDKLPESIKCMYTRREWMWLSDTEKTDLVRNECTPDVYAD